MPSLIKRVKAVLSGLHADLHFVGNRRALYCQQIIYNEKRKKSSPKDNRQSKKAKYYCLYEINSRLLILIH